MSERPAKFPDGFKAAGINCGIKNSKKDLGLIVSEEPCVLAASLTTNKSRAHCVNRVARVLSTKKNVRAIVACSGNANALISTEPFTRHGRMD